MNATALPASLPTSRDENWKYANLRGVDKAAPRPAAAPTDADLARAREVLPAAIDGVSRLVIVNGAPIAALSDPAALQHPAVNWRSGAETQHTAPASLPPKAVADFRFAAVNAASAPHAVVVAPGREATLDLELLFITTANAADGTAYPRLLLEAAPNSRVNLIERHLSAAGVTGLTNAAARVVIGDGARVVWTRLQQQANTAQFIESLHVTLAASAGLALQNVAVGAQFARTTARIELAGAGAELALHGLALSDATRVIDGYVHVEHLAPHTRTTEIFRGITGGRGRVAFNGHITVNATAPHSESEQSLRGLLAGALCELDLRPQLEIYTDAVKASHGATSGKLDDNMMFYLLSRGLDPDTAQGLLKWAFLEDVVSQIARRDLRSQIEAQIAARLGDVPVAAELL